MVHKCPSPAIELITRGDDNWPGPRISTERERGREGGREGGREEERGRGGEGEREGKAVPGICMGGGVAKIWTPI